MNVDLNLYKVFYTVANNKNITKASKELYISQPAISKAIKSLEVQLGSKLFVRNKKGVFLTEMGEILYYNINQAMEHIDNAENKLSELNDLKAGTIKVGISKTLTKEFLLPYLKEFHHIYPKINIEIVTNVASELIVKLRSGLLDVVILNIPDPNPKNDLQITKCKEIQDCFVVGEKYKKLATKNIQIEDLNNYPLILQTKGTNARSFIDDFLKGEKFFLEPNFELASYSLVVEFVKAGFGIGYATKEYIQDEINNNELFVLDVSPSLPKKHIGMAISKNHEPSPSTKKLIEIIIEK